MRGRLTASGLAFMVGLAGCGDGGSGGALDTAVADTGADAIDDTTALDTWTPECRGDSECVDAGEPLCDVAAGVCVALPRGHLIGWRDGAPGSVDLVELYRPREPLEAVDLAFHPTRAELWVLNRPFEVAGQCKESKPRSARCLSFESSTTILFEPGTENQRDVTLMDENAWHFMRRAPALAMGALDTFATCGEAATGNFEDDPVTYMGPALWSSDLEIYAQPSGGNGSHLDMLHETPFCMGIAHERDNVYWLFNGELGAIDRVDFHQDHGPGNDDHDDGTVFRYINGALARRPGVPSHLVFNARDAHLYIVDGGNNRVVKMDTTEGVRRGPLEDQWEILADSGQMVGATLTELVLPGVMVEPSGLAIDGDVMYVSDHATSRIHAFDLATGAALRTLDTALPAGTLAGIEVGPDGKLYFTDMLEGAVYRIDPK